MKKSDHPMCKRPDRDVPKIECGYPLPCPWHTVIIDMTQMPPTIERPPGVGAGHLGRLRELADAAKGAKK